MLPYWGDWAGPWHMSAGWGFWWILPLLMMAVMAALCILFIVRMPWWGRSDGPSSALRLLSERFAKGEISKEEFEEKRIILVRHA